MITKTIEKTIERSEDFREKKFSIKTTRKAYKILSDGLYSDKILAVVREISCNAYDAHVSGKTLDVPFDVHLPTRLDPQFFVRDYGIGLSCEDMENVYTTYFESTKDQDNDNIGCLGLGSKSPFAYTDIFTVVSYFEGKQYTYSAFIDEEGAPSVALMHTADTNEVNGLKVQFDVHEKDFNEFKYKAEKVFRYFSVKPNFVGRIPSVVDPTYRVKRSDWGICTNRNDRYPVAVMGNIAYPVRMDLHDLTELERVFISQMSIDMYFDIGDLEISPNRESLSYDEETLKMIRNRVNQIIEFEKKRFLKEVKKIKYFWDACLYVQNEMFANPLIKSIFRNQTIEWKDRQIKTDSNVIYIQSEGFFDLVKDSEGKETKHFKVKAKVCEKKDRRTRYGNSGISISRPDETARIPVNKHYKVFIDDLERAQYARVRSVLEDNQDLRRVYWISCDDKKTEKLLIKQLGVKSLPRLSEIAKPVSKRSPKDISTDWLFRWRYTSSSFAPDSWTKIQTNTLSFNDVVDGGGFYVPISHWKVGGEMPREIVYEMVRALKELGHGEIDVFGVKTAKAKSLEKMSNWIDLTEFCKNEVQKFIVKEDVLHRFRLQSFKDSDSCRSLLKLINAIRSSDRSAKDIRDNACYKNCNSKSIRKVARKHQDLATKSIHKGDIDQIIEFSERHDMIISNTYKYTEEMKELRDDVFKSYPLLNHISSYYDDQTIVEVMDYINGVELLNA